MKLYVFEGTVEEVNEISASLGLIRGDLSSVAVLPVEPEPSGSSVTGGEEAVSLLFARRVLKRRGISEPMKAVLKALYDAGEQMVPISELCDVSGYTRPQFAGLMGAFGRRISHTQGYDGETYFFKTEWDHENGEWLYSLPAAVRDALVKEGFV